MKGSVGERAWPAFGIALHFGPGGPWVLIEIGLRVIKIGGAA